MPDIYPSFNDNVHLFVETDLRSKHDENISRHMQYMLKVLLYILSMLRLIRGFLLLPQFSHILRLAIPIQLWPTIRHSRIFRYLILLLTDTLSLAFQIAETKQIAVALGSVRAMHGVLAKDHWDQVSVVALQPAVRVILDRTYYATSTP